MPNIEIYGDANLKSHIDKIMQEIGLGDEAITTIINSRPESCDGNNKSMSFVRVCSSRGDHLHDILIAFREKKLGVDTETLLLSGFIPAEKMK